VNWTFFYFILLCVSPKWKFHAQGSTYTHKKTDDRIFLFFSFFLLERGKKVTDCRRRTSCVVLGSIWTSPHPSLSFSVYCLHVFWCCEALLRLLLLSRAKALDWTFNPPTPLLPSPSLCLIFERGEFKQGNFIFRKKKEESSMKSGAFRHR
jgi:hypothetical protein